MKFSAVLTDEVFRWTDEEIFGSAVDEVFSWTNEVDFGRADDEVLG